MACDPCVVDIDNFVATQIPQIKLLAAQNLATRTPWTNILSGGTFEPNQGYHKRALVPNYAGVPGENRAEPTFTEISAAANCSPTDNTVTYGQTEFTTTLKRYRGESNAICVKDQFGNVAGAMKHAVYAMNMFVTELIAMDIRANLLRLSGAKATVNSVAVAAGGIDAVFSGGFNQLAVNFPAVGLPDARVTSAFLRALNRKANDEMNVSMWGNGANQYALVIGGLEAITALQDDEGDRQDYRALTTGKYALGEKALTAYQFVGAPYRGIAYGYDQYPARFNTVDANGNPILISHRVTTPTAADFGDNYPINPDWQNALYEICFFVYKNSFARLVPPTDLAGDTGDGKIKFTPQATMGQLQWYHQRDNAANKWGDYGRFLFQISRAYQPEEPHAIIPVAFKRCREDLGLTTCDSLSS